MSEQVIIDGELSLDSAFDGLPTEQIIVNVTGAPKIIDKASGKIVSIVDGAENEKLLSAVVNIEPVQDLHGYDYPWPEGGGVNILPEPNLAGTVNGVTIAQDGNKYTLTGTASAYSQKVESGTITLAAGTYTLSAYDQGTGVYAQLRSTDGQTTYANTVGEVSNTFTLAAETVVKTRIVINANTVTGGRVVKLQLEKGNTATAFVPYSNICPISGWTQANVNRTGVNVWDEEWETGSIDNTTGANSALGTNRIRSKNYIPVIPGETYCVYNGKGINTICYLYGADKNYIGLGNTAGLTNNYKLQVIPANVHFIRFRTENNTAATYDHDISINYPSSDHSYHAYTGMGVTTALGQTVYGGTLDMLNGKLSVTEALLTLNTANMNNSEAFPGWVNSGVRQYVGAGINAVYNSMLNVGNTFSVNTTSTYDILYLSAQSYGKTQTEWKALAIDVQMIVPLATPLEYDVTPQTIKTLLGTNNIWADAGSMEIEYVADTKLYIQRLTAPTEDDMIANENIASGKFFMVGNDLYLSTAAIVAGETIAPGTNCTKLSLAEALNNINA